MNYSMRFLTFFILFFLYLNSESVAQSGKIVSSNLILQTSTSWDGAPINYPEGQAEVTALHLEIPSGVETGWHYHTIPSFGYVLEGTLELKMEDGRTLIVNKGEALAEVTNSVHTGKSIGENTLKLIVFYTGVTDKELTILVDPD